MRSHMIDTIDPISIVNIPCITTLGYQTNEIYVGAANWLFYFFLKDFSAIALSAWLFLEPTSSSSTTSPKSVPMRAHQEMGSYLLKTYANYYVFKKIDSVLTCYTEPSTMSRRQYCGALENKLLRCRELNNEWVLKELFIKGFHKPVCLGMHLYWSTHGDCTLYDKPRHATLLQARHREMEARSEKQFDRCQNLTHHRGRQGNTTIKINVMATRGLYRNIHLNSDEELLNCDKSRLRSELDIDADHAKYKWN